MMVASDAFDIAMAAIMVTMTVAVVWIIAHYRRKTRVAAYNARLKQLMIERGMSAGEIERVLQADGSPGAGKRVNQHIVMGVGQELGAGCCASDADGKRV